MWRKTKITVEYNEYLLSVELHNISIRNCKETSHGARSVLAFCGLHDAENIYLQGYTLCKIFKETLESC